MYLAGALFVVSLATAGLLGYLLGSTRERRRADRMQIYGDPDVVTLPKASYREKWAPGQTVHAKENQADEVLLLDELTEQLMAEAQAQGRKLSSSAARAEAEKIASHLENWSPQQW